MVWGTLAALRGVGVTHKFYAVETSLHTVQSCLYVVDTV